MMAEYNEPELTYLVLDFRKEEETRLCLESIKRHTKFPYKVVYLHNGWFADVRHPQKFLEEGLLDQLIVTAKNTGLGLGTRDLFAASFSPYSFYLQNDQFLKRDFTHEEFQEIPSLIGKQYINKSDGRQGTAMSVDLAGGVWGYQNYNERAHIIPTAFYKKLEQELTLGCHGAGPYNDGPWREEVIQKYYKERGYFHLIHTRPLVTDNGHRSVRQNPDGSVWEHKVDTKELRLLRGPVRERAGWPKLSEQEWADTLRTQSWPEWKVPEHQIKDIDKRWNWSRP